MYKVKHWLIGLGGAATLVLALAFVPSAFAAPSGWFDNTLGHEGCPVEHVGAILVPGDEVVFHVFAAECAGTVREASVRACVEYERVVESIPVGQLQLRREEA